jgi:hypothetical protein
LKGRKHPSKKENAKIITKPKTGSSCFPERDASVDFDSKIWEARTEASLSDLGSLMMSKLLPLSAALGLALIASLTLLVDGQTGPAGILQPRYLQQAVPTGSEGKLLIELVVKEGFKVAKRPAPKLQVNPTSQFDVAVGPFSESVASKDADYFGGFKPLELRIAPAKTTPAGKYSLDAKLTYFYCSERDKYCSRSVEALGIPVEVAKK